MSNAITDPNESFALSPEALEFTNVYLASLNIDETAQELGITKEQAVSYLNKKEVQRFIDTIFIEQGYMNRFKLTSLLEDVVQSKLEEAEETGVYTSKDLVDVIKLLHDIHTSQAKASRESAPHKQTNVQVNNYGDNLGNLIDRVIKGE